METAGATGKALESITVVADMLSSEPGVIEAIKESSGERLASIPPLDEMRMMFVKEVKKLFLKSDPALCIDLLAPYGDELRNLLEMYQKRYTFRGRTLELFMGGKTVIYGDVGNKRLKHGQIAASKLNNFQHKRLDLTIDSRRKAAAHSFRTNLYLGDMAGMRSNIEQIAFADIFREGHRWHSPYANTPDACRAKDAFRAMQSLMEKAESQSGKVKLSDVRQIANEFWVAG